jgi:hypothetical protein
MDQVALALQTQEFGGMLTTGACFAEGSGVNESKWNCRSNNPRSAALSFVESAADRGDYPHRFCGRVVEVTAADRGGRCFTEA